MFCKHMVIWSGDNVQIGELRIHLTDGNFMRMKGLRGEKLIKHLD